jgi:hypothetical protein
LEPTAELHSTPEDPPRGGFSGTFQATLDK